MLLDNRDNRLDVCCSLEESRPEKRGHIQVLRNDSSCHSMVSI